MDWVREGKGMTAADIVASCNASLKRLKTDVIDLYQIHWPERHVPAFGNLYYDPEKETSETPIHEQLEALGGLVKAGKVREIGLSNETPYGVHEFVRLAEQHGLPRVASVQNVYCLASRALENGLDETMHRLGVSLLAYSPLAFGLLTGKYDQSGTEGPDAPKGARISTYESVRKQRWGRPDALRRRAATTSWRATTAFRPQLALAFCYTKWQVASTIIGVTTVAQLDEDIDAWGTRSRRKSWPRSTRSAGKSGIRRRERSAKGAPVSKKAHVSETPATQLLRANKVAFTEHPYEYLEHGGAQHSAEVLGFDPFTVVKTLVMQDQDAKPLHRADARQPHGVDQESGAADRRQVGGALQARGGAPAQRLHGGRHLALRDAAPDAGLHRVDDPRTAEDRDQRRAARLPRRHRPAGVRGVAGRQPVQCALAE
jgi:aryl-alcohol dehydrogenase-like predicted oxidoreductase